MRAGPQEEDFQVEAICAFVDWRRSSSPQSGRLPPAAASAPPGHGLAAHAGRGRPAPTPVRAKSQSSTAWRGAGRSTLASRAG